MDEEKGSDLGTPGRLTATDRKSDRELVVTRSFQGPARLVFEAWTRWELLMRWWGPEAHTGSCSATRHPSSLWRSSASTSR